MTLPSLTQPSEIERIVMRRVQLIRILRIIISGAVFALGIGFLTLWGIGQEVWVARVFENIPPGIGFFETITFWVDAFTNTRLTVQALVLVTLVSFVYCMRELIRFGVGLLRSRS